MVVPDGSLGEFTMAKPNVHTASRDELVEAGIRAELADEILKLRRKGKIDLETLEEVPGVGPATLEQLRKSLDFHDQPQNGDDHGERSARAATDKATEAGRRSADQAAEVSARTADQVAEVGKRTADQVADASKRAAEQTAEVTRELADRATNVVQHGLQVVQSMAGATRELRREVARQLDRGHGRDRPDGAEPDARAGPAESGHPEALTATLDWSKADKAVDWERVIQLQAEWLRGSLERSAQLTQRYLEVTQAVVAATASTAQQQEERRPSPFSAVAATRRPADRSCRPFAFALSTARWVASVLCPWLARDAETQHASHQTALHFRPCASQANRAG